VFYVNLPVGLLAAAAIAVGLRDEVRIRPRNTFDVVGMTVFVAAISTFLVGLIEIGGGEPWTRLLGLVLVVIAAGLLLAFVIIERRAREPMIPLHLFRNPIVRAAAVTGLLSGMAMFGAITYVPLYLQAVVGSTATQAGWVLMPFVFGWVVFSVLAARLVLRVGYRRVVLAGMGLLVLAFVLLASWNGSLTRVVAARDITLAGIGMGLIFVPMLIAVQSAVPRSLLGSATSLTTFFRTIGGAVGVAVMGAAMTQRLERGLADMVATAPAGLQEPLRFLASHPDLVVNPMTRGALGGDLLEQMRPALADAVGAVFVVGLVIALMAMVSAFLVPAGQARDLDVRREGVTPSGS
jgi:Na+/melibiose symporter-like transporter